MTDGTGQAAPRAAGLRREAASLPRAGFILLATLALFWGGNWPAMKLVLAEVPVLSFRSLCLLVGGAGLLLIARAGRHGIHVPPAERGPLLICAMLNIVGWHLCSAYGVSLMPAGRAAIIAFTMPVWASLLGTWVLHEPLGANRLLALALGLGGLAVLMGPDVAVLGVAPVGALFMLGAAVSWAGGTVLMKRFPWTIPTTALVGWQLLAGAVPITLGAALVDGVPEVSGLSTTALLAMAYVIALPMLLCHWAWFTVVRLFPAGIAAIGTLAIPVVGVFSSALVLGEPLGWRELLALVLICSALAAVLVVPALRSRQRA